MITRAQIKSLAAEAAAAGDEAMRLNAERALGAAIWKVVARKGREACNDAATLGDLAAERFDDLFIAEDAAERLRDDLADLVREGDTRFAGVEVEVVQDDRFLTVALAWDACVTAIMSGRSAAL